LPSNAAELPMPAPAVVFGATTIDPLIVTAPVARMISPLGMTSVPVTVKVVNCSVLLGGALVQSALANEPAPSEPSP
jgi:hypothetical protein